MLLIATRHITLLARLLYFVIILFPMFLGPFLPARDGCLLSRPLRPNYPIFNPPARFTSDDKENNEDSTDGLPPRIVEHTVGARPFVATGMSLFEDYVCISLSARTLLNQLFIYSGPPLRERLSTQSAFFADSVPRSPSGRNIRASTTADSVFDPGSRFPRTP
jgi:hypothetical protein